MSTVKVVCSDAPKSVAGEVCRVLADHRVAVRVGGAIEGLTTPPQGYDSKSEFVTAILK